MELRKYLEENVLLFDGGMGTYYAQCTHSSGSGCELANLNQPELIEKIHREYIEAGAMAIKTNTFGANRISMTGDEELVKKVIAAGWKLAHQAVENRILDEGQTPYSKASGSKMADSMKSDNKISDSNAAECPYIFADIGPVTANTAEEQEREYCWVIDRFLELGAGNFLFETNSNADGLTEAVKYLKGKCADAYIIVSFAVQPDGFSRDGKFVTELINTMMQTGAIDAVGMNCVCGARHMLELAQRLKLAEKSDHTQMAVMPNAGYPTVIANRTFYEGDPVYFATQLVEMAHMGARILGGCCGTTPAHIACVQMQLQKETDSHVKTVDANADVEETAAIHSEKADSHVGTTNAHAEKVNVHVDVDSSLLHDKNTEKKVSATDSSHGKFLSSPESDKDDTAAIKVESEFWDNLQKGKKVIAVELDPPADADLTKFMNGAQQLKHADVDIITIADCPIARARVDSSLLACKVHRELNMEALPHMTCRDRNLNATKALLLGLYAEGLRNALLVTGDPIPSAQRDEVKSVFQFNSRKLAAFVTSLSEQELPSPIHVFGALNVNAYNFDNQLKMAREKLNNGMVGFLTQPVLTESALENLKIAHKELPGAYILGGIIPVVSAKNARFMDSEIHGINVDPRITEMYEGKDREEGEELAVNISSVISQKIAPYVSGFYLMTPFMRTRLICRIIDKIREAGLTGN